MPLSVENIVVAHSKVCVVYESLTHMVDDWYPGGRTVGFKKLASCVGLAAFILGVVTLIVPSPVDARPPIRCTIEVGGGECGPCTAWNSHLCRCVKIPACKV
jgi:hypothetical protein